MNIKENLNQEFIKVYGKYSGDYPFRVIEFATEFGIKVFTTNEFTTEFGIKVFTTNDFEYIGISGFIEMTDGEVSIVINDKHSEARNRFTIAHELGHYFLHREFLEQEQQIDEYSYLYRKMDRDLTDEARNMEIEANQFAMELLMPESVVIELCAKKKSEKKIAKYFNVSIDDMKMRLFELGIF